MNLKNYEQSINYYSQLLIHIIIILSYVQLTISLNIIDVVSNLVSHLHSYTLYNKLYCSYVKNRQIYIFIKCSTVLKYC